MRQFLRALRSSTSRLRLSGNGNDEDVEELRESINAGYVSQMEESNHEEEEEDDEVKKLCQNNNDSSSDNNTQHPCQARPVGDASLEGLTRITKQDTKTERRQKYRQSFVRSNTIMTVTECDIIVSDRENQEKEDENMDGYVYFDSDLYKGSLAIPRDKHPMVPNCCLICLEEYQPDECVVWSDQCEHAFHRDCIVKYFDKIQRKVADTPCPCCRATFTDLTVEVRAKKRPSRRRHVRTTTGAIIAGIPWFRR
ncbi:ring-like zinc finger domain containing protein [Nitzschia inconspicua]|uniref:Ring-like zinc finger domain containing protein n=1 Tax=Nitzschia inconspicua TaxID=303405 RepID=A0A9K3LC63_9STRA|nr:ring-like zinc finger domain containing protein [Nitzschia inconspicua]